MSGEQPSFQPTDENIPTRAGEKSTVAEYERADDAVADKFIAEKVDIDSLVKKMTSEVFKVRTHELFDTSSKMEGAHSLLEAMARLVYEMRGKVLDYDSIIGDDISGRLPTLIIGKLVNRKRRELGKNPVPVLFIAGGKSKNIWGEKQREGVTGFLKDRKSDIGHKTLISTEYISSGKGVSWVLEALKDLGIDYDVSAVSINTEVERESSVEGELAGKVFYGGNSHEGAFFHASYSGVGVMKPEYDWFSGIPSAHSKRGRQSQEYDKNSNWYMRDREQLRGQIVDARKDVNVISEELYKILE